MVRDRGEAFERFSRAVDGPLTVLALVMIPLIVLPLVVDLSPGTESAFLAIDYLIWAVFAAEYAIKLYLAPNRRQFVAHHIPDLIIVLVPMLRPLRVLRSVRLLRLLRLALLTGLAAKGLREARNILRRRGLNWILLIVLVLNLIAAAMVLEFERGNPDANIDSYPDALWWAVTTITTVGYGDRFPMSSAGRGVAVVLMIAGIAMFGVITASIAAYFVEQKAEEDLAGRLEPSADLLRQLDDDPLRAADVAEPITVFVALHLANELRAAGSQASDDGVDIVDCECDMADARGVRRRVPVAAPARRGAKLRQLEPSVAVRGLHHRDLRPDALEPHHAVHPTALDRPLALQLESELDEERRRGREVVDHDAHVLHALDRHALDGSNTAAPATTSLGCRSAGGNAPPIGLKRPAMSCSAQSGHSWVREPMEDAQ